MLRHSSRSRSRRTLVVAAILTMATGLLAAAVTIVLAARPTTTTAEVTPVPPSVGAPSAVTTSPSAAAISIRTGDAEAFARQVAVAIFAWDTETDSDPVSLIEPFLPLADPTGESTPGLVADLTNYLPTTEAWADLRTYGTRQWLTVTSMAVPTTWATAVDQAGPGGLLPGTIAYTVRGIRHRAGTWEGEPVTSAHDVAFTIFCVCAPSFPDCRLLRLSRLDDPLP